MKKLMRKKWSTVVLQNLGIQGQELSEGAHIRTVCESYSKQGKMTIYGSAVIYNATATATNR